MKVGVVEQKTKKGIENQKKSEKGFMKSLDFGNIMKDAVKKEKPSFGSMQSAIKRENKVNNVKQPTEEALVSAFKAKKALLTGGIENEKPNVRDQERMLDFEGDLTTTEEEKLVRKKEPIAYSSGLEQTKKFTFSNKEKTKLEVISTDSENASSSVNDKETIVKNTAMHDTILLNQEFRNIKDSKQTLPSIYEAKYVAKIESANGNLRDSMSKKQINPKEHKEAQQIEMLKYIAKELRSVERESARQKTFPNSSFYSAYKSSNSEIEPTKHSKEAKIHLNLPPKTNEVLFKKTTLETKEIKMQMKENIKADEPQKDTFSLDMRTENFQKNTSLKASSFAEVKEIIMKDVDRFVDVKIMSPRKILLTLGDMENGRMEIQVEKKDNVIFIKVRIDEKGSQEKVEASMEQLKAELKEKAINIEYDVEKEQKEKRKEQEQRLMKEDIREEDEEYTETSDKFERFMEVGQI